MFEFKTIFIFLVSFSLIQYIFYNHEIYSINFLHETIFILKNVEDLTILKNQLFVLIVEYELNPIYILGDEDFNNTLNKIKKTKNIEFLNNQDFLFKLKNRILFVFKDFK